VTKPISTGHVTATVTTCGVGTASGDAPENAGDKIAKFMSRVVPWPTNGSGYIGLHWHLPGSPFRGRSVSTVDEFLSAMETVAVTNSNIYFCLSQQAIKDARSAKTATYLKAIWLDVDVKAPPKGYATLEEAYEAVTAFVKQYNLPAPSAVVQSGGGLHVYWISNRPLSVSEWHPYALGLKSAAQAFGLRCDAGITVDAARVLRVPGTKNFKTTPPRPVKYAGGDTDYDFAADLTALRSLTPPVVASQTTNGSPPPNGKLSAGVKGEFPPLDPKPIFKGCPWLLNALRTAGRDYDQPQWHLSTLCATFMENGHDIAHQMGNQHPGYSRGTTDSLWERKYRDRADKGIGWPSCRAIQDAGSRFCEGCSHFAKGKSPLNLALPTARADQKSTVGPTVQSKINPVAALMSCATKAQTKKSCCSP
jgi:hypothetical protein